MQRPDAFRLVPKSDISLMIGENAFGKLKKPG